MNDSRSAFPRSASRRMLCLAAFALAAFHVAGAQAQSWPSKPVTLLVGVPAGGALDPFARTLADQLGKVTGGTFVVENRPGANGNLSAEAALKAPADGHTLWIGTQSMLAINPAAFSQLRWKQSDFKPILKGVEAPLVLVTHPSVPAKNFGELAKWIQNPANKASYASFSPGTPSHFLGYQLNERLNASMVHIAYKGSAPQVTDILGGQVPLGFTQLASAVPHIKENKLNAIAVTGPQRSRYLPQVPTLAELGYKDLGTTIWFGLFAPAATPPTILEAIRAAALKVQADPGYRGRLEALNFDVPNESVSDFEKTIAAETARWAALVKATGFKAAD
ncbi:tripartite tricarboxylate transporter substrate binding protein [Ramlibacter sp. AW1]|uniref:Tripartite tricarboxylate transporter substrate binding protein n=1 Tax=Ramlibacter aurantiacus TaxID=2801330 RepID=A0A937D5G9_9BURK|nr:tripartite tricarboxylate transporter substrate binding protein [Ramlibacter aurantiacus]MBL0418716.1 tripartite tricarboxylate transporter substrate binding protein [Ramlibacter aurantiacus]